MLSVATDDALEAMIARIVPTNPKKRKFMSLVAAAATSLAAGTVLVAGGCGAKREGLQVGHAPLDDAWDIGCGQDLRAHWTREFAQSISQSGCQYWDSHSQGFV